MATTSIQAVLVLLLQWQQQALQAAFKIIKGSALACKLG